MKKTVVILLVLAFICSPMTVLGMKDKHKFEDLKIITTDELKRLYDSKEDFLLINTLSPIEFKEQRIKGSVNMPYLFLKKGTVQLPEDKTKKMVFYCKGPK
jgi:rhodanese-related sulfurtransferase